MNMGILPNSALNWLTIISKPMSISHLIMLLQRLLSHGFLIRVQIIMKRQILLVWRVQNLTLVMIICMLVMVRALLFPILFTLKFIPQNAHLLYPIFYMFLPLKNLCYLFKNFAFRITCFLNFIHVYFMLRTSWQRKWFFPVRVEMVYMFCLSCLPCRCLRLSHLHVSLLPLISGIVDLGIQAHAFCICWWKIKKVSCTSKLFNFNCPVCPLGKSCRLTLKTTGHQTLAPLDLIFSDV